MCDVLFVVPSMSPSVRAESGGTLLLATILKENGITPDIYRFHEADLTLPFNNFIDATAENILKRKPKIVSFYCRCDCFLANIKIAQLLKSKSKDIIIVFGGPQADASSKEIAELLPYVDYTCCGEGETTIYPLMNALLHNEDTSSIQGLTYKNKDGVVIKNPRPALFPNLDELPDIDYSLIPDSILRASPNTDILIDVGRGCPFNCAYCSTSYFWQRTFRLKSPQKIADEISYLHQKYGYKKFTFSHDLFTANKKKVIEFCNELKHRKLDITWSCSSRVDTLDESTIAAMAECGLDSIFIGIETGSPKIQKLAHKHIKRDDVINVARLLTKYKIKTIASFMYGFPEETEEDLEDTLRLAYDIHVLGVRTSLYNSALHRILRYLPKPTYLCKNAIKYRGQLWC